jgi:hypothetical protein
MPQKAGWALPRPFFVFRIFFIQLKKIEAFPKIIFETPFSSSVIFSGSSQWVENILFSVDVLT